MNPKRLLSVGLVIILGCLLGIFSFSLWDAPPPRVERVAWSPTVQWIGSQSPNYRLYARRTIDLPNPPQAAWIRLSADNDFVLYVNGKVVARELSVLYNSIGLSSRLHEVFQVGNISRLLDSFQYISDRLPYRWLLPEFLNLSNAKDWKITPYVDLTAFLSPGKNVIALEVQKGRKNPRLAVEGAIYITPNAAPIDLSTGSSPWQTADMFETRQGIPWFDPAFAAEGWGEASLLGPVQEATYSRLSQHLFDRPLQGSWITATEQAFQAAWFQKVWQVQTHFQRAFVRVVGKGEYTLIVNGQLVKRFESEAGNQMYLYEVTNLLHTGANPIAVRLAHPLTSDPSIPGVTVPQFLLDGWVEDQGQVADMIATDDRWQVVSRPRTSNSENPESAVPVSVLGPPDPRSFLRTFAGNADLLNYPKYVSHQIAWVLAGIGVALGLSWMLGWFWLAGRQSTWERFNAGTALLLPATLFLIGISLLKHRYVDGEEGLLFAQPQSNALVLIGFAGVLVLTLLGYQIHQVGEAAGNPQAKWWRWGLGVVALAAIAGFGFTLLGAMIPAYPPALALAVIGLAIAAGLLLLPIAENSSPSINRFFQNHSRWLPWVLLVLIVAVGFGLRIYHLGFMGLESDENTSLDAIRGILRTGAPETTAGIWYTRSPAYHYLTALWLLLVGNTATNARLLSVLWGTATLVLVFFFTRKITGNIWIALIVTTLLALDPWQIWYSRSIRFYQIVQFSTIAMLWWFLKGFVEGRSRLYQSLFFAALTWTLLNQEGMVILLPSLLLGFLCFYRPFRLAEDWPIVLGAMISGAILYYDLLFVRFKTLTPWVAVSTTTGSLVKLHLSYVTLFFTNFFVGPNRMRIILSIFFFLGFWLFLKRRNTKILFLFSVILLTLLLITLLIVPLANRYAYPVYPIFMALAVYSAICVIAAIAQQFQSMLTNSIPLPAIALSFAALLLIGNLEIGRVLDSYGDAIVFRSTEVSEYIRDHRQPRDIVVSAFPAAHANTIGRPDYVIPYRTSIFDAIYQRDGQVRDRWDGGVLLNSIETLNRVLEKSDRVWIHIFDRLDRPLPTDPELSEFRNYLQMLGQPAMETFGTRLRLWERKDGILPQVGSQGKDLGNY